MAEITLELVSKQVSDLQQQLDDIQAALEELVEKVTDLELLYDNDFRELQ